MEGSDTLKRRNKWVIAGIAAVAVVIIIAGLALWNYHEQPQFCALCHEMEPYLESWNGSDFLAYEHAEEGVTCLDCHEPTLRQQVHEIVVHMQGDFKVPLKERKFPMDFCFDCHLPHEHTSYEQVIERTEDYTVDDEKVNPHDPHAGLEGMKRYECRRCHKVHKESPGINYCYGCHHLRDLVNCSECHGQ